MKNAIFLTLGLTLLSMPFFVQAQEGVSEVKIESAHDESSGDYKVRLVPEFGMSSMGYTGKMAGDNGQGFSGGLTTEIGTTKARLLETGVLFVQSKSTANIGPGGTSETISTSQLGIPLMAKLRFIDMKSQSWYAKLGAITTFQTSSNRDNTNTMDVLGSVGVGARVPLDRKMDIIVEASYARGLLNAFLTESSVQEGVLVFTGVSIAL
jgi:hypothetical protein